MTRMAVLASIALASSWIPAVARDVRCDRWLEAFNRRERMVKGERVEKADHFEPTPINANEGFDGVARSYRASRRLRRPALKVEWGGTNGSGERVSRTMKMDNALFEDLVPMGSMSWDNAGTGRYSVTLSDGQRRICTDSKPLWGEIG